MINRKISIYTIARKLRKNMTRTEKILWEKLRNNALGVRINRQTGFHFGNYRYVADFCCHSRKLIIEIDGDVHLDEENREYDGFREDVFRDMGYKVIRFTNEEVINNINQVVEKIKNEIIRPSPPGPLSKLGEGEASVSEWGRGNVIITIKNNINIKTEENS